MPPFSRNSNPLMQTRPCHISVVSPVYRGEKMVAELVNRIVQSMNTIPKTDSVDGAVLTDAATAPADKTRENSAIITANTLNIPPLWSIRTVL